MANTPRPYERLPGRNLGFGVRGSLWLGSDHVLVVQETMTGESYRRIFFRDLQAIVIRATDRHTRINVVLLVLGAINLFPLLWLTAGDPADRGPAWIATGAVLWIALLLVNTVRGPTCETRFRTAVQDDIVPPLGRRRTAGRVADTLRPRILAAQAAASPAEMRTGAATDVQAPDREVPS